MKRAVWAAIVAASVGSTVALAPPVLAQTPPATPAAPAALSPEAAAAQAAQGQANADGSPPPNAGGLHADLLGANIPLRFTLNGYFRTRFDYINHVPITRPIDPVTFMQAPQNPPADAAFAYMRLRLDPAITYGSDPLTPMVALRSQIDLLNNVVFGDNVRAAPTPLFAENPSSTGINGSDNNIILVRRLWLEFLMPIGQIRIGRMASHGGLGLLFNDGNGFRNDWGDANGGSTFDRILFATRPLTIVNALTRGDARPTPLILALAYDWLVQDPLGFNKDPSCLGETGPAGSASTPCMPSRSPFPLEYLTNGQNAVQQATLVLAWNDPRPNPNRVTDELSIGFVGVNRTQGTTQSNVWIYDAFWRARYSVFGNRGIQPFTNGEIYTIQGQSYGLGLKGLSLNSLGRTVDNHMHETPIHANIWGGAIQAGVAMDDRWQAMVEGGYATGDANLFDASFRGDPSRTLTQRAFASDYRVGLLLFPVAVQAMTANHYIGPISVLQSNGGVWNASYLYPQFKLRVMSGIDLLGAVLLAWADKLNDAYQLAAVNPGAPANHNCGPFAIGTGPSTGAGVTPVLPSTGGCFLGWEVDIGLKITWGDHDLMRWSNEFGVMGAGDALGPELRKQFLWTFQSRFAMVF